MTPEIDELEKMIDEIMQLLDEALSIPSIPEAKINELLDALEYLNSEIETLASQEKPLEPMAPGKGVNHGETLHPSSQIYNVDYNPKTQELQVKYMGKDQAAGGPTYSYKGVSPQIVDEIGQGSRAPTTTGRNKYHAWQKGVTPSHGATVNQLVKQAGIPYRRIA